MARLIIIIIASFFIVSCEQTLPYNSETDLNMAMTINAVAVRDTTLEATLTAAQTFSSQSIWHSESSFYDMETSPYRYDQMRELRKNIITDADVELVVNGKERYSMQYDDSLMKYRSTFVPQDGDKITISAKSPTYGDATAKVTVPKKSKIEVTDHKFYQDDTHYYSGDGMAGEFFDVDTVMDVTCKITDPEGHNYYRLVIRSTGQQNMYSKEELDRFLTNDITDRYDGYYEYYFDGFFFNDLFRSDDPLFYDASLTERYGGWPAYFTDVFSDALFDGGTYTFTIKGIHERYSVHDPRVHVELQSLSPEMYQYLKSIQRYRIKDTSEYSENIYIYSNVDGGFGIFGGISSCRVTVPYND